MKAAAIGTFDGVHRGHRSVLNTLARYAQVNGFQPLALTFDRHPLSHISPERTPSELTPLWKKKKLLEEVGVIPVVLTFDESLRSTTAEAWMKKMQEDYDVVALVIGYDNTFGCDGVGMSLEDYKRIGEKLGIEVLTAEEVKGVSSSAIRKAVAAGDMERAEEMLGRPYSITALVVSGNRLGHTLGFPTANVKPADGVAVPKTGVYAAIVKLLTDGSKHPAMVNVGSRPTVMRGEDKVIEAHLIDWDGNLYDKEITVRFIKRIRDEIKFDSIESLKQQLKIDKEEVMNLLKERL